MSELELRNRIAELEQRLDESEQLVRALQAGEIDAVVMPECATPVLLLAAQENLRAKEKLLRAVFEGTLDAIVIADDDGRYVDANAAACALFGVTKEELLGRRVTEFRAPEQPSGAWDAFRKAGEMRAEFALLRADGGRRTVDGTAVANVLPGLHLAVLRDITERRAADAALADAEQRLRTVVSNAPVILFAFDRDGIYTLYEGRGTIVLDLQPEDRVGRSVFTHFGKLPGAEDTVRRALAGEVAHWEGQTRGGYFEAIFVPVIDDAGKMTGVTGVGLDVTLHKSAQLALRTSDARFRAMLENGCEATWLLGKDGKALYASPSTRRVLGVEAPDVVGSSVADWVVAEDRAYVAQETAALAKDGSPDRVLEFRVLHRDGKSRWVECIASNMTRDPAVEALVWNIRDISERKAAEVAFRNNQRLLETAQEVAHLGSWAAATSEHLPISWSRECARIFGRAIEPAPTPQAFMEMVHPEDRARVIEAVERAVAAGVACETEHRIVRPTGELRWVYAKAEIEGSVRATAGALARGPDGSGRPYGVVGVVQDITDKKRVDDELRAIHLRYRRIVDHTSEGIWMYDAAGVTTFMNPRMASMLGWTVEEAIGQPVSAFMDADVQEEARARVERRVSGISERGELRLRRRDGSALWASLHADPLFDAAGTFESSLVLVTDVTDRRRADETHRHLAAIVSSSDDAIYGMTPEGTITSWNRGAELLFGYSEADMVGASVLTLLPADRTDEEAILVARLMSGDTIRHYETVRRRKDGTMIDVSLSVSPIRNASDRIVGISKIARDISDRRRAETALRRTEEQLRQAQKMEAVGSLAGGIAHDFNNLLSVILSYASLIVEELKPSDPLRADLQEVEKAALRASALTSQLLAFSRKQLLQPVVLDLNGVLAGVEKMLGRLLGEDIDLSILPAHKLGMVHADPGQLEQVIMNLVVNARDAMAKGGKLTIETRNVVLDEAYAEAHAGVTAGPYVMLAVTDTGAGMDAATKERIFEPFFTTKDKSKGTGLGLSMVYGIIQQSHGHIWLYSELGTGTTFKIYLPRTARVAASVAPFVAPPTLDGTETILLVEDEDQVRTVMRSILQKYGYNVLEAQNGGEAFLVCEQFTAKIHLLVTDVIMPRMSGRQLAERLAQLRPAMKVLFVSGYTENTIVHHGVLDAGIEFLPKPITPDALVRKVRQVLDRP